MLATKLNSYYQQGTRHDFSVSFVNSLSKMKSLLNIDTHMDLLYFYSLNFSKNLLYNTLFELVYKYYETNESERYVFF